MLGNIVHTYNLKDNYLDYNDAWKEIIVAA